MLKTAKQHTYQRIFLENGNVRYINKDEPHFCVLGTKKEKEKKTVQNSSHTNKNELKSAKNILKSTKKYLNDSLLLEVDHTKTMYFMLEFVF